MNVAELAAFADSIGVAAETVARWHVLNWRHEPHKNAGRPKGKAKRPVGTLSVAEIARKHGIKATTLAAWRAEGLPHRRIGSMIVMDEAEVLRWMRGRNGNRV
jgi:hypothetical protein